MQIPPIHNFIVKWEGSDLIYLLIFDTLRPYFFRFSGHEEDDCTPIILHCAYEEYMKEFHYGNVSIYIPTIATTVKEARQLHPELFI